MSRLQPIIYKSKKKKKWQKHTTVGIRWWSPTQLLVYRSEACVWQSGRDAQFSSVYGRMYQHVTFFKIYIAEDTEVGLGYLAQKRKYVVGT